VDDRVVPVPKYIAYTSANICREPMVLTMSTKNSDGLIIGSVT
jgi:hypothetical protein